MDTTIHGLKFHACWSEQHRETVAPTHSPPPLLSHMPKVVCDRCDGEHASCECPHFKWERGHLKDEQPLPQGERPALAPDVPQIEASGKLQMQPVDGPCLYHALVAGGRQLGFTEGSTALRKQLASWVRSHADKPFNGRTIEQWLQSELGQNMSADAYGQRQSRGGWGGAIEILAYMLSKHVNVWVWVPYGRES